MLLLLSAPAANASFGFLNGLNMYGGGSSGDLLQFDGINSVDVASDGSIFVLDGNKNRVVKLSSTGTFLLEWGIQGSQDGEFSSPTDLVIGAADQVLVADSGNRRIQYFDQSGGFLGKWGSAGSGNGQFNTYIGGLAIDSTGDVFATDTMNNRIQHFDPDGTYVDQWGTPGTGDGQFDRPVGISFAQDDTAYVVDRFRNRVQYFAPNTHVFAGKFGCACSDDSFIPLSAPLDVFVDKSTTPDEVYISNDFNDNRITRTSLGGTFLTRWGNNLSPGPAYGSGPGEFNGPQHLVVRPDNKVYVADRGNNRISVFTGASTATPTPFAQYGGNGTGEGQFNEPTGTAAGPNGSVYVSDLENNRIQHLSVTGQVINQWGSAGTGDGQFDQPRGLAVGVGGDVYVADSNNNRIQRFTSTGTFVSQWTATGGGGGPLSFPVDVETDAAGNVYVANGGSRQVVVYQADGTYVSSFGQQGIGDDNADFQFPASIAVDPSGTPIYVSDEQSHRIKKFDAAGGLLDVSAPHSWIGSTADGLFSGPNGIDIDPVSGELLVADSNNHRIQRLSSSLDFVAKYGQKGRDLGQFFYPRGMSFDENGNLWIGDSQNDRVQRFGDAPTVTIDSPVNGSVLTGNTTPVNFSVSDAAANCDLADGATVGPLSPGVQTITVTCTNSRGTGAASVNVTVPSPPAPPATPLPAEPDPVFTLNLKKKIKPSRRVRFSVVCSAPCKVETSVKIGRKTTKFRTTSLPGSPATKTITVKISKSLLTKINRIARTKKPATFSAKVVPQTYKAKQGKSGKASMAK